MSKMFKIVLIAGVVLILCGGLVYGAAYAVGERRMDRRIGDYSATVTSDILNFTIDVAAARVNINTHSANEINIEARDIIDDAFSYDVSGRTLTISYRPNWTNFLGIGNISIPGITSNRQTPVINISIPENMTFDNFEIDGGIGDYNIEYVNATNFNINGGVGKTTVRNSTVDRLKIYGGVGEYDITGDIGEMDINGGVGKVSVSGSVARDIKINGGVGEVRLDVTGDISNYDVRSSSGVGTIRINGDNPRNFSRNSDAPYRLTVDGGVGSVNINIK
jgi:hypothetical protein